MRTRDRKYKSIQIVFFFLLDIKMKIKSLVKYNVPSKSLLLRHSPGYITVHLLIISWPNMRSFSGLFKSMAVGSVLSVYCPYRRLNEILS